MPAFNTCTEDQAEDFWFFSYCFVAEQEYLALADNKPCFLPRIYTQLCRIGGCGGAGSPPPLTDNSLKNRGTPAN